MIYKVSAKLRIDQASKFHEKLTDGTILKLEPDGPEIVASMKNATIDESGQINWTELCYCPTPLMHERTTVYDQYFTDMKTEQIRTHEIFKGKSFMAVLASYNADIESQ